MSSNLPPAKPVEPTDCAGRFPATEPDTLHSMNVQMGRNMTDGHRMTFEEMARLVDETRESHYYLALAEEEKWQDEQDEKAKAIVPQLERHLPPQLWQEMLELFKTYYGAKCAAQALHKRSGCTDSLF
jgi:hypothetical protein